MSEANQAGLSRRDVLKATGGVAAATALAGVAIPQHVYAAQENTIRLALVGCGGRGTGAASDALSVKTGPTKLVAMADVFEDRLNTSYNAIKTKHKEQVDVPHDRRFIGFDAYKKAIDCLRPGDVVILATPPAFRWVHFTYAIAKGINVFMEKPVCVDGPTGRRMLALGEEAAKKNMKVGVGLMCRHSEARHELSKRIKDGRDRRPCLAASVPRALGQLRLVRRTDAGRHERPGLSDPQVPRVPVGQRRTVQRFPDPQHRRMLLDEGCLSDLGQGLRRTALPPVRLSSTRTSTATRSNTRSPTGPS